MPPRPTVEQAAILAAQQYAAANGYRPDDRRAVGLVLAGMAIASSAIEPTQRELVRAYVDQLPEAAAAISGWARLLDAAAMGFAGVIVVDG